MFSEYRKLFRTLRYKALLIMTNHITYASYVNSVSLMFVVDKRCIIWSAGIGCSKNSIFIRRNRNSCKEFRKALMDKYLFIK